MRLKERKGFKKAAAATSRKLAVVMMCHLARRNRL